jgi:hypothetical protein
MTSPAMSDPMTSPAEVREVVSDLRKIGREDGWIAASVGADLIESLERQLAEANALRERDGVYKELAFNGNAVFAALTDYERKRTGPENVSDTLDALVRVAKQAAIQARKQEDTNADG